MIHPVLDLCAQLRLLLFFFFFNDTATTEIYTLSLHDALPICSSLLSRPIPTSSPPRRSRQTPVGRRARRRDRKSTRLNSSHLVISYAVFCLKKKKDVNYVVASMDNERSSHTRRVSSFDVVVEG